MSPHRPSHRLAAVPALGALLAPLWALGAQPPRQPHAGELARSIDRLAVVGNVLYVAAHPDDENTRLLAWLANERLLRTGYLSITRGDGGQNLLGAEQGPLLGLIRTQELLAARRVDGAEQLFTRARDFGYSKNADETLAVWDREAVLADVVWAIRSFKPDVIITRFQPQHQSAGDTHGHHVASAILAQEAFARAADPSYRPDQVALVGTWQARRILWNKSLWNAKPDEDLSAFLKLDVGGYNPQLGVSYGEMAAESRSMHKSQGFGAARTRGPALEYFRTLAGAPATSTILDGVDLTWGRVGGNTVALSAALKRARADWKAATPEAALPALLEARAALAALPDNPWKAAKERELTEVIVACAGLYLEANAADWSVVPGGEVAVTASALLRRPGTTPIALEAVHIDSVIAPVGKPLGVEPITVDRKVPIPRDQDVSHPYWLAAPPERGMYPVQDAHLVGLPELAPPLRADFELRIGAQRLTVSRTVFYKWTDPVAGERYRSVEIAPPVMVNAEGGVLLFPDAGARPLRVLLKAGKESCAGVLRVELPPGWTATPAETRFALTHRGDEQEVHLQVRPPAAKPNTPAATGGGETLRLVATVDGQASTRGVVRIEYPHLPIQTLFPEAVVKLVRVALQKGPGQHRIGYIAGAGDDVPAALRQVGYEVSLLPDALLSALPAAALQARYDAIVVGVRAYNTQPALFGRHQRLMDYVAAGGTLLVQYVTNNRLSKLASDATIGPHPFTVGSDRVTDENAAVARDRHAVLQEPNRLDDADFAGWVQERGLYFATQWSPEYETPLAMSDAGEPPRRGGLLVCRHGKGAFVYTGLAFFRQLPAGVPGAYRLFANLIAYGHGAR